VTPSSKPSGRKRTRIAEGVYSDTFGVSATVKVGGVQREQRFPRDTSPDLLQAWRAQTRAELLEARDEQADDPTPETPGTFAADAERYLKGIAHRVSYKADRIHLRAWLPHLGPQSRHRIRSTAIQGIVHGWDRAGVSPQTIKHRVRILRTLYKTLDQQRAKPPLVGVVLPKVPAPQPIAVQWSTVQAVAKSLRKGFRGQKRHGKKRTMAPNAYPSPQQSHARFLVLATTGQRPAQLMRALPSDIDLKRGIWFVRPAKGGTLVALPLNPAMMRAWALFIASKAWGTFDTTAFSRLLRRHGWPAGVRPYQLRHTFAIDMILGGADIRDVQAALGHRQIETTTENYAPIQLARWRKAITLRRRGALV
jgi:integrase